MGVYKNNNGTLQPIAGRGGALIDDTLTTTSNTWSASKMNNTFVFIKLYFKFEIF